MLKVYIFGHGFIYSRLASYLPLYRQKLDILGIITTEKSIDSIDGYPCFKARKVDLNEADYIIIAVEKWREIADYLTKLGADCSKFIRANIFFLPYFDLDKYLNIRSRNISIIANDCLGGMVYKELGMRALSPTINAFSDFNNYSIYVNNLEPIDYNGDIMMQIFWKRLILIICLR